MSRPLPRPEEQAAIDAAFPTRSGRHDLCAEARRLVSERHGKGELVALVNWLLHREERAKASARFDRASHDDLKAEAIQAEVSTLKAICNEAADSLAGALECIREEVVGGLDEEDERAQVDLIRRLREAGGREA